MRAKAPHRHDLEAFAGQVSLVHRLRVTRLSDRLEPKVPFPHSHNFFQIIFVAQGGGMHEIDSERYQTKTHPLFLVHPGQIHAWQFKSQSEGVIIEFETNALDN